MNTFFFFNKIVLETNLWVMLNKSSKTYPAITALVVHIWPESKRKKTLFVQNSVVWFNERQTEVIFVYPKLKNAYKFWQWNITIHWQQSNPSVAQNCINIATLKITYVPERIYLKRNLITYYRLRKQKYLPRIPAQD